MTAENDPDNTNFLYSETQESALFCYALIRFGSSEGVLFKLNGAPM
jgi:hypothetical protein